MLSILFTDIDSTGNIKINLEKNWFDINFLYFLELWEELKPSAKEVHIIENIGWDIISSDEVSKKLKEYASKYASNS